jgi:putative addiction module component (TIGR02574 family)
MDAKSIEQQALELPTPDRERLARKLLDSLDVLSESEQEQLWLAEAARRAAQVDQGEVELVAGEEVARKARALLR